MTFHGLYIRRSSVGVWEQLHCFFFAIGVLGGGGGRRRDRDLKSRRQAGARLEPGQSDDGKQQVKKKQWSYSHTPTEGSAAVASAIQLLGKSYHQME